MSSILEFSLAQTPLDHLLQLGLTLSIWLRFNFISLLNRSCINLMFPCTKWYVTQSKEVSLSCTFWSYPASLPEFFPGQVTPYPISYLDVYPDSYPRLCPIPYPSRYPEPYSNRYLSRTQACYPELYLSRYPSRTRACYPELYPSTLPDRVLLTRPYPVG
jgi:hypothetical protein